MKDICSQEKCTGCGACVNVCPKKCIKLIEKQGFLYPNINKKECIGCSQCVEYCPNNKENKNANGNPKVIAAFYAKCDSIKESTSGGIFPAIAEYVLKQNGKIYGAIMNENLEVYHKLAGTKQEYQKMRGSKYIQSDTKYTFFEVKELLENNTQVLYVGTPCQIAGLYSFLKNREYTNLITIDLVCHGVGSKRIFDNYVEYLENKYKSKITNIHFRSKKYGYDKFTVGIKFKNGREKYIRSINDIYMSMYYKKGIYRESCYTCRYARIPRIGDITLGDFAEIDCDSKVYKKSNNKGISLILLNNEKAQKIFDKIKNNLCWEERSLKEAIETNHNVGNPTVKPIYRDKILEDDEKNIKKLQIKYCKRRKREYIALLIGEKNLRRIKKYLRKS